MFEEKIDFETGLLFYNPNMRFSRSLGSLSIGAIKEEITILDGFAASGIRGLRYAKENANVKKLVLLDVWKIALPIIKKNAQKNMLKKFGVYSADFNEYILNTDFDFIEIDPFGSPVPYLNNMFYSFNKTRKKIGYISLTATDVAVLCGENTKACLKKYGAKNLRNEFTHEVGVRVLLKKIGDFASQFDCGVEPYYSISDRHYIKILLKITRSAEKASQIPKTLGYVSYCFHCGYRETGKFPGKVCTNCKKSADYGGPLWLGELHNKSFLKKMKKLNEQRNYADKNELEKILDLLIGETDMPPFYYDTHYFCKIKKCAVPKINELIEKLRKNGFMAVRTHFDEKAIKTNATIEELEKAVQIYPSKIKGASSVLI